MAKMKRKFVSYTRQTGAKGKISDLMALLISVMSSFKHVEADFVGSSSGHGIQESGKEIYNIKLMIALFQNKKQPYLSQYVLLHMTLFRNLYQFLCVYYINVH